jgi:hypothetical protein
MTLTTLACLTLFFNSHPPSIPFSKQGTLIGLHNPHRFFCGSLILDGTILTRIISKCVTNLELKFFQVDSFLVFLEFLSPLRKLVKL